MLTKESFDKYWSQWLEKELTNYNTIHHDDGTTSHTYIKKGYEHLDRRIWLPDNIDRIKVIIESKLKVRYSESSSATWWQFQPFIKSLIKIPKYKFDENLQEFNLKDKIRPICFASHIDSLIYGFYSFYTSEIYEDYLENSNFNKSVLAYRTRFNGDCNIQFCRDVFDEIRARGECTVLCMDIKGFFDNLDHRILKEKWQKILKRSMSQDEFKVFKSLTQYAYVKRSSILKKFATKYNRNDKIKVSALLDVVPGRSTSEKFKRLKNTGLLQVNTSKNKQGNGIGIPQGSPMSAILSNIYMVDFDAEMNELCLTNGASYRRYCDDLIIICNHNDLEKLHREAFIRITKSLRLPIQDKKTQITLFTKNKNGIIRAYDYKKLGKKEVHGLHPKHEHEYYKPLQYLGFEFDGKTIRVRPSSLSRYFVKTQRRIVKTVMMAYGSGAKTSKIKKRQILERYTHKGKRNFLTYCYNASKANYTNKNGDIKQGLDSIAIRKQLSNHFEHVLLKLDIKNRKRHEYKKKTGKKPIFKST